jgi:hypothetical protein
MLLQFGFVRGSLINIHKNKCRNSNKDQQLKQRWKPKLLPLIQINNIQISYERKYTFDTSILYSYVYNLSCSILDVRCSMLNYFFSLSSYFIENTDCVHNKNCFFALSVHLTENQSKLSRPIVANQKLTKVFT